MEEFFKSKASIEKKEDVIQDEEPKEVGEDAKNIPEEESSVSLCMAVEEGSKEEKADIEPVKKFKALTPEELLVNKAVFEAYVYGSDMNILVEIAKCGFDLNEVIAKAEKIHNFLNAVEDVIS